MFRSLNGTVQKWVTFNEPVVFCSQMAAPVNVGRPMVSLTAMLITQSTLPPNLNSTVYPYTCSYHLVLAHAKTVQRFRELNIRASMLEMSENSHTDMQRGRSPSSRTTLCKPQSLVAALCTNPQRHSVAIG